MTDGDPTLRHLVGSVTSPDGTVIGHRRVGSGPALVIVHGGMQAASSHSRLAERLAHRFAVYSYDRRGRGSSGPAREDHGMAQECQDLAALLMHTGARYVFGHSSGALIALQAALTLPISRIALYEPPLSIGGSVPTGWLPRFQEEIARQETAAAMVTAAKGLQLLSTANRLPRWLLVPVVGLMLRTGRLDPGSWAARAGELVPTQLLDMRLVREMESTSERFRSLPAEVLLLGGSNAPPFLRKALDVLEETLPRVRRTEFPGLAHNAPDDSASADQKSPITRALEGFFVTEERGAAS
jgi:pimeloyl-ACP methyl ester carboxylesterase